MAENTGTNPVEHERHDGAHLSHLLAVLVISGASDDELQSVAEGVEDVPSASVIGAAERRAAQLDGVAAV